MTEMMDAPEMTDAKAASVDASKVPVDVWIFMVLVNVLGQTILLNLFHAPGLVATGCPALSTAAILSMWARTFIKDQTTRQLVAIGSCMFAIAGLWLLSDWTARSPLTIAGGLVTILCVGAAVGVFSGYWHSYGRGKARGGAEEAGRPLAAVPAQPQGSASVAGRVFSFVIPVAVCLGIVFLEGSGPPPASQCGYPGWWNNAPQCAGEPALALGFLAVSVVVLLAVAVVAWRTAPRSHQR
jgi:hypothetical protein